MALLYGLLELREEFGLHLLLGHLNHCARGTESEEDAHFVRELGERFQLETFVESIDVPARQTLSNTSFQETARNIRLEFLEDLRHRAGAHRIALGHTADDQAETVLMNFLRGSGARGMGGMRPVRPPFIRPLIDCFRDEILGFLDRRQISFRRDSSNEDKKYLRNRVRLDLVPLLQEQFNPDIRENLLEVSRIFQAENDWMDALADREFERLVIQDEEGFPILKMEAGVFRAFPLALQRRLIRRSLKSLKGDLKKITFNHIQSVLGLLQDPRPGKRIDLPEGIQVECEGNWVVFKRIPEGFSSLLKGEVNELKDFTRTLAVPGQTRIDPAGIILESHVLSLADVEGISCDNRQAYLDLDKTGETIQVRFFQPGDRIRPLGLDGTKKVKSLLIDEKIPQKDRATLPILTTAGNDIIWVFGARIGHPFRVTEKTKRVLFIKGLP